MEYDPVHHLVIRYKFDGNDNETQGKMRNSGLSGYHITLCFSTWWRHQMETFSALLSLVKWDAIAPIMTSQQGIKW